MDSIYILAGLFFVVSFAYASVGLGGGSSYTALMALFGVSAAAIPMVSLMLNLFVTSVGSYNFLRNHHGRLRLIAPFLLSSIPMAYVGGALHLPKEIFYWILFISLLLVVARLYFWKQVTIELKLSRQSKIIVSVVSGAILGLIAGIVGIGGGIYLVPLIVILGLGTEKQAAACAAVFIWLNSAAGLASRLQYNTIEITDYVPLIVAVLLGGFAGSFMGSYKYSAKTMDKILGVVVLVAVVFLGKKLLFA